MKVSVITAVYNNRTTIAEAIDSVLSQKGVDCESIVIDGASNDGTTQVLSRYAGRLGVLVSEPDHGIYDALNKGISRASGDIVGFLHSDDVFANDRALSLVSDAFADPSVDAVYSDLVYVQRDDPQRVVRYWRAGEFAKSRLRQGWMPPHPTFYVRRSLYERLGAFDTTYRIAADYECLLRILGQTDLKVVYIPEVLVKMRVGGASNRSIRNLMRKSYEDYRAMRRHGVGGLFTLLRKNVHKLPQFLVRPS